MPPLYLLVKPASSLCDLRCRYCFYTDEAANRSHASYGIMSEETLELLVRRAFSYADGSVTFAFQGGEPTLAGLDFYRTLARLEAAYNTRGLRVFHVMQTNGMRIDDEWAAFLAQQRYLVGLSMDGDAGLHDACRVDAAGNGTYDRVQHAAQTLIRHHVDLNILCVITEASARQPDRVYETLKPYRYIQFISCLDPLDGSAADYSLSEESYGLFLRQTFARYARDFLNGDYVSIRNYDNYVRLLCGEQPDSCAMAGRCTPTGVVEADGSVYPCDFYALDAWRLGSIRESGFDTLLTSEKALSFVRSSACLSDECRRCPYLRLCRGGCRRDREPFTDGDPALNRHCAAYRSFFAYCLPLMCRVAEHIPRRP